MKLAEVLIVAGVVLIPVVISVVFTIQSLVTYFHPSQYDHDALTPMLFAIGSLVIAAALGLITSGILLLRKSRHP